VVETFRNEPEFSVPLGARRLRIVGANQFTARRLKRQNSYVTVNQKVNNNADTKWLFKMRKQLF
jgi:hypothetical protein